MVGDLVVVRRSRVKHGWRRAGIAGLCLATAAVLVSMGYLGGEGDGGEGQGNVLLDMRHGRELRWRGGLSPLEQLIVLSHERGLDRMSAEGGASSSPWEADWQEEDDGRGAAETTGASWSTPPSSSSIGGGGKVFALGASAGDGELLPAAATTGRGGGNARDRGGDEPQRQLDAAAAAMSRASRKRMIERRDKILKEWGWGEATATGGEGVGKRQSLGAADWLVERGGGGGGGGEEGEGDEGELGRGAEERVRQLAQGREQQLTAFSPRGVVTPGSLDELVAGGKGIMPARHSSKLWDFPDIKRYQVQTDRESYWPNMAKMEESHSSSMRWPGPASGLSWPTPDGSSYTSTKPQMVKAGALIQPGELMRRTRPWVAWSAGCSSILCPLGTPQRERAVAWRYCTNHFVTNAEARYCFAAVLSPAKPPPSCPPYSEEVPHGSVSGGEGRVTVGGRVDLSCDEGYMVNAGPPYAECQDDGTYTAVGECVPITCGPYPAPEHSHAEPGGGVEYGGVVNVTCGDGWEGGWQAQCGEGGQYSGEGECVEVTCPPYPPPPHAGASPEGRVQSGGEVEIQCEEGYHLEGETVSGGIVTVVCGPDGTYVGEVPECVKVKCPPLAPPEHGNVSISTDIEVGGIVEVTCQPGYEPLDAPAGGEGGGGIVKECQPDGTYPAPEVVCVPFCPPFPPVPHGRAEPQGKPTHSGDRVDVECDRGFYAEGGEKSAVCGEDGKYNPPSIACLPIPECPAYPVPAHGRVSPGGCVSIGGQVSVECDEGYTLSPNSSSTPICTTGGVYDVPSAQCLPNPACPPYPKVEHGSVTPERVEHVGDQVEIECDEGYELDKHSSSIATCEGSEYDYPSATCVPLPVCPPLVPPEHGHGVGINVTLGKCVPVECDEGYQFDPDSDEGMERPCCIRDIIEDVVRFEEVKKCYKPDQMCDICNDIDVCPHCFIGNKKYAARRREFNFDR